MTEITHDEWRRRAAELKIEGRAFIGDAYADSDGGETFACVNPADGRTLAQVARCREADAKLAVANARRAFNEGEWSQASPQRRKKVLQNLARLIGESTEELALLETLDMGKPIINSIQSDLPGSVKCVEWHAESVDKIYDEIAPTSADSIGMMTREPIGVVAAIVPWNFPLLMAAWKFAPALAAGNSVILKPSEKSPLSAIRIAKLFGEAGLPPGVLQVLPGFGNEVGAALALDMDVDCIAFTGSGNTGKKLLEFAGQSNMKRVYIEAGGKTPNIVFADCTDPDAVAQTAADAIFYDQGEVCNAGSRLMVESKIKDEFLEKVIAAAGRIKLGDPLNPETTMGAIVDEIQLNRVMGYIQAGKEEGASLALGGSRKNAESGGFFIEPTIFDRVQNQMKIAREEIFGPVLSVIEFDGADEAVKIANDTSYGLAAAIWTRDLTKAHRTAKRLRVGSVWINNWDGGDMTMAFGGFKQSGNGRDKSLHALDKYTEVKSTWIKI